MTNEEAIETIEVIKAVITGNPNVVQPEYFRYCEVLSLASEALENQIKYKWTETKELPPDGEFVLMKGHGHDVIVPKKGETIEKAMEQISKIEWCDIGFYSVEDEGWCYADGFPHIIAPEKWKPIDWSE